MASSGSLQSYLPAQYSPASKPTIPLFSGVQAQQPQEQNGGGFDMPNFSGSGIKDAVNTFGSNIGFGGTVGPVALTNAPTGVGAVANLPSFGTPALANALPGSFSASPAAAGITTSTPTAGALGTSTGFSSVLAGAGAGYALGGPLGKIGGNPQGGQILGAVGGAVGSYAAGTAAGAALGAGLGIGAQALNFVLPGIGILVGGIAGGFFGKKKNPHPASLFLGETSGDKGLINDSYDSKHMDTTTAKGVGGEFASFVKNLKGTYGIDIGGQSVFGGSDKGRNFIRTNDLSKPYDDPYGYAEDSIYDFNLDDPNSRQTAYNKLAVDILKRKNMYTPELEKQINEIGTVEGSQKQIAAQNKAAGRSPEGIPLISGKKDSKELSFAQFTQQNNQNRWS